MQAPSSGSESLSHPRQARDSGSTSLPPDIRAIELSLLPIRALSWPQHPGQSILILADGGWELGLTYELAYTLQLRCSVILYFLGLCKLA